MKTLLVQAKRKVTEQSNVLLIFIIVHVFASVYGWVEGEIYPYYPFRDRLEVLGHFTWYHMAMLALFALASFSIAFSRLMVSYKKGYILCASLGSMAWGFWIEDMVYFAQRYPKEVLGPDSWVNWGLSGYRLFGHWIPTIYYILAVGGFALYAIAFIRSSKEVILARAMAKLGPVRSMFKARGKLEEAKAYFLTILLYAILTIPIVIVAAYVKDLPIIQPSLARIIAVTLTAFVPTLMLLIASSEAYLKSSLKD
jgi:hypothetical protein